MVSKTLIRNLSLIFVCRGDLINVMCHECQKKDAEKKILKNILLKYR